MTVNDDDNNNNNSINFAYLSIIPNLQEINVIQKDLQTKM